MVKLSHYPVSQLEKKTKAYVSLSVFSVKHHAKKAYGGIQELLQVPFNLASSQTARFSRGVQISVSAGLALQPILDLSEKRTTSYSSLNLNCYPSVAYPYPNSNLLRTPLCILGYLLCTVNIRLKIQFLSEYES